LLNGLLNRFCNQYKQLLSNRQEVAENYFGYSTDTQNISSIKAKNDSTSQALTWEVEQTTAKA
jgi:hypothetical protein